MKSSDVRQTFLNHFAKRGHQIVASSPLVPANDPTLMFTAAGMVQFKNVFTGLETRPYTRAATAQKCVRAGGKHNDLDNVGFTARHHTFFEMMGNFSFGAYFKEEAILYAWELINGGFQLPKDRLLVTVYHDDDEAIQLWKKIAGFGEDRIIRIATSDNFWSAGDTGPCGPCTEVFFDHGDKIAGGPPGSAQQDGDRYIEFWNNVFMQFDQLPDGSRVPLARQSIDTGLGLERTAAILQGKTDNYDTDIMRALIEASAHATGVDPDGDKKVSHRVIADHLRASAFLIADGVMPSNEGRGYVLRRIMRRAMRHAHILGAQDPLLHRLFPTLQAQMGLAYPELKEAEALIIETLKTEETRFKKTLDNGLHLLTAETDKLASGQKLSGSVAFKLYDTYGFPLDLTQDILRREQGREVDIAGFQVAMEEQRAVARKSWVGSGAAATEKVWFDIKEEKGATEFLGYHQDIAEAKVVALVDANGAQIAIAPAGMTVTVVVNQTPFYGESGGQAGDGGIIQSANARVQITDTQKKLGLTLHVGKVEGGALKVGDDVRLEIDHVRRQDTKANHSATHLLHAALRARLGKHVTQKGSLVTADRLRFDISHPVALTADECADIEATVNTRIRDNSEVTTRLMPIDEARAAGAMAMFGEKYDDEVRVLCMGGFSVEDPMRPFSIELCGGTHVQRTGDIGLFKIVADSALAAGIRRIEAVTGRGALSYFNQYVEALEKIADLFKAPPREVVGRVTDILDERRKLEKDVADLRRKVAVGGGGNDGAGTVKTLAGVRFTSRILQGVPAQELKPLADELKTRLQSGVVAVVSVDESGKASLVVSVTADLAKSHNAVDLVKIGSAVLGGKGGGGRPDMAQAGGPDGAKAAEAITAIEGVLAKAG